MYKNEQIQKLQLPNSNNTEVTLQLEQLYPLDGKKQKTTKKHNENDFK